MISEDDPTISVERVSLRRPDAQIPAYAAWPVRALANTPSVVVVMHIWGVDAPIRDAVLRLAKSGFAAIAPDLFARFDAPNGDGASDYTPFRAIADRLDRKQYGGDLRAGALWLRSKFPQTKIGILGFCLGGRIALVEAIDDADIFSAVVPFYGSIKGIDPEKITIPVCGSYGAQDQSIPADDVRAFRNELRVPNDVRIYNTAGHAFCDDTRERFVPSAAEDAWKRSVTFLREHLGVHR